MPRQAPKLSEKHWQALKLIEEGKKSLKEIAASLNWSAGSLYDLYQGNVEKANKTAILFEAEVKKISARNVSKIKNLIRDNKVIALCMMNDFLRQKANQSRQTEEDIELIVSVFNALAKATPSVEINANSYSYVKGLSAEELMHEFNKLKSLAEGTPVRGGIPGTRPGSSRILLESLESGSGSSQEPEDT